jgi:hypothetical protein
MFRTLAVFHQEVPNGSSRTCDRRADGIGRATALNYPGWVRQSSHGPSPRPRPAGASPMFVALRRPSLTSCPSGGRCNVLNPRRQ